jgi:Tol biopolymer transport system component
MRKKIITAILLVTNVYLFSYERHSPLLHSSSQQSSQIKGSIRIVSVKKIISGDYLSPQFTADGKKIVFTGENFRGLWISNIDGSGIQKISDELLAGWKPVSTKYNEIIFRTGEITDKGEINYSIKKYDLSTKKIVQLYAGKNEDVYPPKVSKFHDNIVFVKDRKLASIKLRDVKGAPPLKQQVDKITFSDGGKVWYLTPALDKPVEISKGRETCGGDELSPDGKKVAYLHGNTNSIIIYDFETDKEINVGEGSTVAWSPDSQWIAYSVSCDDGHYIIHSDIFIVRADGSGRQRLTFTEDIAEVNPSWSPDGKSIVCEDALGSGIYLINLEFNQ